MKPQFPQFALAAALAVSAPVSESRAQDGVTPEQFAARCAEITSAPDLNYSVPGDDSDWFFLSAELRHLSTGAFWEKDPAEVTQSKTDATEAFLHLKGLLDPLGVELIYVPVPAKGAIYPEKLMGGASLGSTVPAAPFFENLRAAGVTVIDIEPQLRAARGGADEALSYCMTDAHPTPSTCELIAELVAEELKGRDWVASAAAASDIEFAEGEPAELEIRGDLIPADQRGTWPAETITVTKAGAAGTISTVEPSEESSPLIVLGDSHTMIFSSGGEMLATGAGLVDHLQAELGFTAYLAASRGSSSQALRQIYQPAEFWEGKRAVVWIASARELTQERRWLKLPRLPK